MGPGPRSSTSLLLACACTLGLLSDVRAAGNMDRCQRNPVCRVYSEKGILLSEQKHYAEALSEFQAAYNAEPEPRLLLNIGRSLYRLDRSQEALDYYGRYRKAVSPLDPEDEQTLRRYELDALIATATTSDAEPSPGPLGGPSASGAEPSSTSASRRPPSATLALFGIGAGCLILGIGLGAGASRAATDFGLPANNFAVFGEGARAAEARGLKLQTSGVVFDVLGLVALTAGAASLGTWFYLKKSAPGPTTSGGL